MPLAAGSHSSARASAASVPARPAARRRAPESRRGAVQFDGADRFAVVGERVADRRFESSGEPCTLCTDFTSSVTPSRRKRPLRSARVPVSTTAPRCADGVERAGHEHSNENGRGWPSRMPTRRGLPATAGGIDLAAVRERHAVAGGRLVERPSRRSRAVLAGLERARSRPIVNSPSRPMPMPAPVRRADAQFRRQRHLGGGNRGAGGDGWQRGASAAYRVVCRIVCFISGLLQRWFDVLPAR